MIDVDHMAETQVFRLHKREVAAAACREAMEAKWGVGKGGVSWGESGVVCGVRWRA